MTVDVAFHLTYRKGYQSKLLFVHSKGCRCNLRGLLHSDDRKSPWWASRVGTQHDRSRFDTVIISMNLNSYASLAIFFIIPDLFFCFWPQNYTYYTRVSCVWFLSPSVSLQSNWTWKLSEPGLSISFSLWRFSSLLALQWRKLRRLACLKNLCLNWFFCCYLPARLFRNFTFNKRKEAKEQSGKWSDIFQFGRWRDSFCSALSFVLW